MFEYTSPKQQIQKLKSQHLSFDNEDAAQEMLERYGYYNIINGYREPYIMRNDNGKTYNTNVTFEQIYTLFALDHAIRDSVLLSMIDLEEHLRAVVADIIAESFGSDHMTYLKRNNYRDKYVSNPNFRRNKILDGMLNIANASDKQPIKYYREHHTIVPPWILLKGVPFGTLVNYIRFFKSAQRNKLIRTLYGDMINESNIDVYKDLLSDSLFACLEYRNLAAHGGRIYNYVPNSKIRFCDERQVHKGIPQLLHILSLFKYQQPFAALDRRIGGALSEYCNAYPNDLLRIESATGFKIIMEKHVLVNEHTHIYHIDPYCSGSKKYKQISLDQALQSGFRPCKRCARH